MKYEIRHWLLLSYWKVIFKVLFLLFLSNFIFVSYFSVIYSRIGAMYVSKLKLSALSSTGTFRKFKEKIAHSNPSLQDHKVSLFFMLTFYLL